MAMREVNIPALDNWAFSHGGYEPNTDTQLVLENNRSHPVRIIDMRVIKKCGAPVAGTLLYSPDQGNDADIRLGFDLDSNDAEAYAAIGWYTSTWKPDYFANFTVSIGAGSQQVFNLRSVVTKFSCQFRYQITALDGERKIIELIGDDGQPFRASALLPQVGPDPFTGYSAMYAGGVYSPAGNDSYVKVNPQTFSSSDVP
jgi:hypothetical protein